MNTGCRMSSILYFPRSFGTAGRTLKFLAMLAIEVAQYQYHWQFERTNKRGQQAQFQ